MHCPVLTSATHETKVNYDIEQHDPEEYIKPDEERHPTPVTVFRGNEQARQYYEQYRCAASENTGLHRYHRSPYTVILLSSRLLLPSEYDLISKQIVTRFWS